MNPGEPQFEVLPAGVLPSGEASAAKDYWASLPHNTFYARESHWATFMAETVVALRPRSVFEFGCNVGRNLAAIRDRDPTILVGGVDVNAEAIELARAKYSLDVNVGDESYLTKLGEGEVDVIFTVSVLDHMSEPRGALADMVRVARMEVLLLEPYLGREGKVVKNTDLKTGALIDTTPYSYSWDYEKLARDLAVRVMTEPYPLSGTNLGRYYNLYRLMKMTPLR